jgi:hypothetical protein
MGFSLHYFSSSSVLPQIEGYEITGTIEPPASFSSSPNEESDDYVLIGCAAKTSYSFVSLITSLLSS